MHIKQLLSVLFIAVFIISCNSHSKYWETIHGVETYIEKKPDSVLAVLEGVDVTMLRSKEEKAKYALLYSMALDKNYIDKTDFDVLQPAIDYYKDNGSETEKLRTYYYQGRIYHNQGKVAKALECYINAIENGKNSNDILTKARLHIAQCNIYVSLYEWDNAIESCINAINYFKEAGINSSYVNSIVRLINYYTLKNEADKALPYIEECKRISDSVSHDLLSYFYASYLTYTVKYGNKQETIDVINEFISSVPNSFIDWTAIATAYNNWGMSNEAIRALSKQKKEKHSYTNRKKISLAYYEAYKDLGEYKKALEAFEKYQELHDSINYAIYTQDTKFVKERHELELDTLKERESKNRVILWGTIFIIFLFAIIIWIRAQLKLNKMKRGIAEQTSEKYRLMYEQIEEERDNLTELLSQNDELEPDVKAAVARRLELLNKFFTAYITNNSDIDKKANTEMEELLANKDTFMSSTKLAFAGSHPGFIKHLEDCGLTDWEINYCCLYAMGLKGKEVGTYMRMRSHYNNSSEVRDKLGINEHETNLGIYIRKLLKSFE